MKLFGLLTIVTALLRHRKRISYRALGQEFELDDAGLEALRFELVQVEQIALDQDGEFLVWAGEGQATVEPASLPARLVGPSEAALPPLRAIGVPLAASPCPPLAVAAREAPRLVAPSTPISDAERRPLTVMFCDLADSTALSAKLDPEDLQDVIRAYQERCTAIIQEYEGFVAKYMGDGILVYFGYPISLERNAERAVRSGLAIVAAMAGLNAEMGRAKGIEIAVRIGIATGLVMVGEIVGEGLAQERAVIGEAPNVAARFQGLAGRNGIVVGALTREVAGDAFVYQEQGAHELKGITGRVKTWAVTGLTADIVDEADQETDSGTAPPALIGRDEETGLLRRAWQSTKDEGRGQVVLITGEAGIGKSVLVDGLRAEVRAEGLPRIAFHCSPYHTNSALYPVTEHLKRLLRWQPGDAAETQLAALEAMLGGSSQPLAEVVPLFASLLSLALPEGRWPPLALSPQQQKQQTQDALIGWMLEEAERQPLLTLWEDLHWADPSTLELIGLLIEQAPTAPLLIVLTSRPELAPPWPARSHMTPITLNRLERQHSEAMVTRLAGDKPLPAEVVEHIVIKTDGVPLYVEELTKTILASAILRATAERFELTGPLSSLAIPATLQESLMARLDRLPQVRDIAQLGSVLGREFAYEMLSGLSTVGEVTLQEGLGQLVEAELLYQRGRPPRARYTFKHALVQDAAYQSLLRRPREQYHRQVALLLESKFPEVALAQPELLARHYTEAGSASEAVTYWQRAGEKALQRSATPEAIGHLGKGLEELATLPETPERIQQELDIQLALGPALIASRGYGAPEVAATYRRARALCEEIENPPQLFTALRGFWNSHLFPGDYRAARELAEDLLALADSTADPALQVEAHRALGTVLYFLGETAIALTQLEQGIALYDAERHRGLALLYGADPGSVCRLYAALTVWLRGSPQQAQSRMNETLTMLQELSHAHSQAIALAYAATLHQFRREAQPAHEQAAAAVAIATRHGFAQWAAYGTVLQGWALAAQGERAEGVAQIHQGLEAMRATGAELFRPYFLTVLAQTLVEGGHIDEGLQTVAEALAMPDSVGPGFCRPELCRLKGELLLMQDLPDAAAAAESCFRESLDIARQQQSKSWELRAATSLARRWRDQGKPEAACELLAPVYDWFTEGFDTADLRDAKALLDDLSGHQAA